LVASIYDVQSGKTDSTMILVYDVNPAPGASRGGCDHYCRDTTHRGQSPGYVKPYVKRGKNDRADAEGICEAVQRPTMRFVSIKSEEQQALLVFHRFARRWLASAFS
jgi:hypothetical protein